MTKRFFNARKFAFCAAVTLAAALAACAAPPPATVPPFETGADPEAWARVPAGHFLSGAHNTDTVVEYDYEIMVNDVTNAQYAAYLNRALAAGKVKRVDNRILGYYPGDVFHAHRHEARIDAGDWLHIPLDSPDVRLAYANDTFSVKPPFANHPMTMVTWFGAQAYCTFNGGSLPTEAEWEKAARGTDGRPYPWGSDIAAHNANYYKSRDPFERTVGGLGVTTPIGFYNGNTYDGYATVNSPSPYGVYDMAGNVWQWTADIHEGVHYRYLYGGSKGTYEYNLRVWTRNSAGPDYASPEVGFRCVRKSNAP